VLDQNRRFDAEERPNVGPRAGALRPTHSGDTVGAVREQSGRRGKSAAHARRARENWLRSRGHATGNIGACRYVLVGGRPVRLRARHLHFDVGRKTRGACRGAGYLVNPTATL
jgi:hypothetical protein